MRLALAGVQGAGKSTLFQAFTGAGAPAPGGRPDAVPVAVVKVGDPRLEWLRDHYEPEKYTPAAVEVIDIPGLPPPGDSGTSRRGELLAAARETDGLILVVRAFRSASYPYPREDPDPIADLDHLLSEMAFADLDIAMKRLEKIEVSKKKSGSPERDAEQREASALKKVVEVLEEGGTVKQVGLTPEDQKLLKGYRFLTAKPWVLVLSLPDGGDESAVNDLPGEFEARASLCGQVEAEIAELPEEDRLAFLEDLGVERPASEVLLEAAFRALGAVCFFTVGEDEVRSWTVEGAGNAVEAAGCIHSDLARGFIRAEVTPYDDLHDLGDMQAVKKAGKQRLEGKEYVVKDGDILNIRFSV